MAVGHSNIPTIAQQVGPELYSACAENDVARVEALTSRSIITSWPKIFIVAASKRAVDVATYCLAQANKLDITDEALRWVLFDEESDPIYHFLVESKFVDVNYFIERWGTLLGVVVSVGKVDRHSLVEYLLDNGANPNHTVEMQGHKTILACAAGYSDENVVKVLLDHGAQLEASGALVLAAQKGKMENVKLLIARGADPNEMGIATHDKGSLNNLGKPLHKAVENGHFEVVDMLLQDGVDLALEDTKGRTVADIAAEKGMDATVVAKLKPDV